MNASRSRKNWRNAALLLLLLLPALACGKKKKKTDPSTAKVNKYIDVPVKKLYDRAEAMMNKTHHIWLIRRRFHRTATPREMFQEVTRRPDAGLLRETAEIRIADSYRLERSDFAYAEAIARYKTFNQFHPRHPLAEEVQWSLSQCYYLQHSKPGRDQNMGRNAETELHDYITRFAGGPHIEEARRQIVELVDIRARHELNVGDFYIGRRAYAAGQKRIERALLVKPEVAAQPDMTKRNAKLDAAIAKAKVERPVYLAALRHPLSAGGDITRACRKAVEKLHRSEFTAATFPAPEGLCPATGKEECLKSYYVAGSRSEKEGSVQGAVDHFLAVLSDPLLSGGRLSVWAEKSLDGLKNLKLDGKSAVCWPGKSGCGERPLPPRPAAAAPPTEPPPEAPPAKPNPGEVVEPKVDPGVPFPNKPPTEPQGQTFPNAAPPPPAEPNP